MIRLKTLLKEQVQLTSEQEAWLDLCTNNRNRNALARTWKLNPDGTVTVNGDFDTSRGNVSFDSKGRGTLRGVKFNSVASRCQLSDLKSLEGVAQTVGKDCYINRCDITTLQNAPKSVTGNFEVQICDFLESLDGAPKTVGGDFIMDGNGRIAKTTFSEENVRAVSNVKGQVLVSN
jgi:hypothetical protein